jgi:flagellar hook-basal body complex protein FliE
MSVLPIAAATPAWSAAQVGDASPTSATSPTAATGAGSVSGSGDSFSDMLGNAIDSVNSTQTSADSMATQAASGSLTNVADYMVTAEEANIQTELTSAVRNSALQSFQQIMGMQL